MRTLTVLLAIAVLGGSAAADEKKGKSLQLKDLPAAVQKQFVAAAKAVAKLETTISHCKGRV